MEIYYQVKGTERTRLAKMLGEITKNKVEYLNTPTFAYKIGDYEVDRAGTLKLPDGADYKMIMEKLKERGYKCVSEKNVEGRVSVETDDSIITNDTVSIKGDKISLTFSYMKTDANFSEKLEKLIKAKQNLFEKVFNTKNLDFRVVGDKVSFSWLPSSATDNEINAAKTFFIMLIKRINTLRNVTCKEHDNPSEKYSFRCFLLTLGLIGSKYKADRKWLMKNLSGSASLSGVKKSEVEIYE